MFIPEPLRSDNAGLIRYYLNIIDTIEKGRLSPGLIAVEREFGMRETVWGDFKLTASVLGFLHKCFSSKDPATISKAKHGYRLLVLQGVTSFDTWIFTHCYCGNCDDYIRVTLPVRNWLNRGVSCIWKPNLHRNLSTLFKTRFKDAFVAACCSAAKSKRLAPLPTEVWTIIVSFMILMRAPNWW